MREHPIFRVFWYAINTLLVVSFAGVLYSFVWEYSTRSYLRGFADSITPNGGSSVEDVQAILSWMKTNTEQPGADIDDAGAFADRDPEYTLNSSPLLMVCGTATNAFVNLARSSNLSTRRLLLLDQNRHTMHVVAEVLVGGRWIVVDPSHRAIFQGADGHFLTREELANPAVFNAAIQLIPHYPAIYSFQNTVHVHLSRIPVFGDPLRKLLNFVWPSWEVTIDWTLLLERESFAALVVSMLLLGFALLSRFLLGWYCSRRLGVNRPKLRDHLIYVGGALLRSSKTQ
jgi:hypothetical protein